MVAAGVEYVFIGDDFTGASDTLATLARAGRRVRLFLDPPDPATIEDERLDAVGIATELRALPASAIARQVAALAPTVQALSPRFVHYKVCSTFDSAPEIGSIGTAVAVLRRHLDPALVAVIGGQPSLGRYCAFANLFARGPDGDISRIDRHPVMRNHPITPTNEADLRVHLAAQGLDKLHLLAFHTLLDGPSMVAERISGMGAANDLLFDVLDQGHLDVIGGAFRAFGRGPLLIVGASSVAEAFYGAGLRATAPDRTRTLTGPEGPCLVIAGSRSEVTAAQVSAARHFDRIRIGVADLADASSIEGLADRCATALRAGTNVLAHLDPSEDYHMGGAELSRRLAELPAAILDRHAVPALGVAGGDTSSIVVRRLGFASLAFEQQLDPGVGICVGRSGVARRDGMRLMLKGGQVGSAAIFDRFALASLPGYEAECL